MSNVNIIADFETSLATKIAVGGETATLVSNIDDDGQTLPDGLYNFTLDGNNSSKEHIICTKTGANLTAIKSVSRQGVESVGVVREHRVGAKVIMTDFSTFKNYIDNIALQGATSATEAIQGVALLSVAAVAPATPIVVGDNDPRLLTTDQKAALAGNVGTPSATNKYVTESGLIAPSLPIIRTYLTAASPATWTKPAGLKYILVEVQAGGGGGGGADNGPTAGCGGGGGGYSKKLIAVASLGSTETVTIGAGGNGGASTGANGESGGVSSFGSHCSATAGSGGTGNATDTAGIGGAGGVGSNGDVNLYGGYGFILEGLGANTTVYGGGAGGSSQLGTGGPGQYPDSRSNGYGGYLYGGGGGGAKTFDSPGHSGGAGAPGVVIVTEYYI